MLNKKSESMVLSKTEKNITKTLLLASGAFGVCVLFSLLSGMAHADSTVTNSEAGINANLLSSISLSIMDSTATSPISGLSININPTSTGSFSKASSVAHVYTSNRTGYTLYISSDYQTHAGANTASLINANTSVDDTTTSSIGNIPTLSADNISESDFSAANSSYKNSWGYSRNWSETVGGYAYSGGSATTYRPVPVKGTQVVLRNDVTRQVNSSNTTVTVGANVDTTKASGTYNNKLVFTALANSTLTTFTLNFNANGGSGAPSSLSQSSSATSYSFAYPVTTPTRSGKTFLGWASSASATVPEYTSGSTIPVVASGSATVATRTVYAVWE